MKFEKFVKNCGARGTVVKMSDDSRFLMCGYTMVRIPEGVTVLSAAEITAPNYIEDVVDDFVDDVLLPAELRDAKLPCPDAKPSEIERIFANIEGGDIAIDNKTFGYIERADRLYTFSESADEEGTQDALVITNGYEDESIVGIVFNSQYIIECINKEEK